MNKVLDEKLFEVLQKPMMQHQSQAFVFAKNEYDNISKGSDPQKFLMTRKWHIPPDTFTSKSRLPDVTGISQLAFLVSSFSDLIWETSNFPIFHITIKEVSGKLLKDDSIFTPSKKTGELAGWEFWNATRDYSDKQLDLDWIDLRPTIIPEIHSEKLKRRLPLDFYEQLVITGVGCKTENVEKQRLSKMLAVFERNDTYMEDPGPKAPAEWVVLHERIWKTRIIVAVHKWALLTMEKYREELLQHKSIFTSTDYEQFAELVLQTFADELVNPVISMIVNQLRTPERQNHILNEEMFKCFPLFDAEYVLFNLMLLSGHYNSSPSTAEIASNFLSNFRCRFTVDSFYSYLDIPRNPHRVKIDNPSAISLLPFSDYETSLHKMFDSLMLDLLTDPLKNQTLRNQWIRQIVKPEFEQLIHDNVIGKECESFYDPRQNNDSPSPDTWLKTCAKAFVYKCFTHSTSSEFNFIEYTGNLIADNKTDLFQFTEIYQEAAKQIVYQWYTMSDSEKLKKCKNSTPNITNVSNRLSPIQKSIHYISAIPQDIFNLLRNCFVKLQFFLQPHVSRSLEEESRLKQEKNAKHGAYAKFLPNSREPFVYPSHDKQDFLAYQNKKIMKLPSYQMNDAVTYINVNRIDLIAPFHLRIRNLQFLSRQLDFTKKGELVIKVEWIQLITDPKENKTFTTTTIQEKKVISLDTDVIEFNIKMTQFVSFKAIVRCYFVDLHSKIMIYEEETRMQSLLPMTQSKEFIHRTNQRIGNYKNSFLDQRQSLEEIVVPENMLYQTI